VPPPVRVAVYITWEELFGTVPEADEVIASIRMFNRQSTLVLLSRLEAQLFLDLFLRKTSETIALQGFLISNFWDDEVLSTAKEKMGQAKLDERIAFHSQQILAMMKWVVRHSLVVGGDEPDKDQTARFTLGRALLKMNSLLLSDTMKTDIAQDRRKPSARGCLRLQLSVGAGNEVSNPPPAINAIARSATIFSEILKTTRVPIDLSAALEKAAGLSLETYVDLILGVLANYISRTPKRMIAEPQISVLDPRTFFGSLISPQLTECFWDMETTTIDDLAARLSVQDPLVQHQDFTAFRMKPFVRLDNGNVVCLNPGFVQEKLEAGLFWTIANNLEGEDRQFAFDAWGRLFEAYVNRLLQTAVDPDKETYLPHPEFSLKKHHHESFDGILVSGRICAVFECKGGFLPNPAKYADNLENLLSSLNRTFGADPRAGVEQLVRKITQVFAKDEKVRRKLEGIDLSAVSIVVPVMVVQDGYVSSMLTVPWLAKTFRDLMRKSLPLSRNLVWTSLLVVHIEDVETLFEYVRSRSFSLADCLLQASKFGDPGPGRIFSFENLLREFIDERKIGKIAPNFLHAKLGEVLDRVTTRLFGQPFKPQTNL